MRRLNTHQLALQLIFGDSIDLLALEQQYTIEQLNSAYRLRVKETHPDRALALGKSESQLTEGFRELNQAYHALLKVAQDRQTILEPAPREDTQLKLLVSQGRLKMRSLLAALRWQQEYRPRVGALAVGLGLLLEEQRRQILNNQPSGVRFCALAEQKGWLQKRDTLRILAEQSILQPPLSEYLVSKGYLSTAQVEQLRKG